MGVMIATGTDVVSFLKVQHDQITDLESGIGSASLLVTRISWIRLWALLSRANWMSFPDARYHTTTETAAMGKSTHPPS